MLGDERAARDAGDRARESRSRGEAQCTGGGECKHDGRADGLILRKGLWELVVVC